jgi:proteasome accessory factor B
MAANRTERLLNLVICLLATRRRLTKEQIRHAVPQYEDCDTEEAFSRMFERDKEDLRDLGIPLATGSVAGAVEDEFGYRIDRDTYALPDLELTAAELAVLGLASRLWQQTSLSGPAARALVKLRALGIEPDDDSLVGVEPRLRAAEPAFDALYAATRSRTQVTFVYRKPDGSSAVRRLHPWLITSRTRWWYVIGFDLDRDDPRVFRLSRIVGPVRTVGGPQAFQVPEGLNPAELIHSWGPGTSDDRQATVALRPGRGAALRMRALSQAGESRAPVGFASAGWELLTVPVWDVEQLADQVCALGPDAILIDPPDAVAAVVHRLRGALAAHPPDGVRR